MIFSWSSTSFPGGISKNRALETKLCWRCRYDILKARSNSKVNLDDRDHFCESSAGRLLVLWFPQATTLSISNSLPTNEDICSSVIFTWGVCYSACTKVLCFTITNKHERSTEAIACEKQTYFRSSLSLSLGRPEMRLLFEGLSKRM